MKNLRKFNENFELDSVVFEGKGKERNKLKDHILRHLEDIEESMTIPIHIKDLNKMIKIERDLGRIVEKYGLSYDDDSYEG